MLVTLKEILSKAEEGNYAVGAFNSPTLESARAAIEAAEELQVPIILSHAEVHFEITPLEIMGPILVELAKKVSVPQIKKKLQLPCLISLTLEGPSHLKLRIIRRSHKHHLHLLFL